MGQEQTAIARANAGVDLRIGTSMFALRTTQLKEHALSSFLNAGLPPVLVCGAAARCLWVTAPLRGKPPSIPDRKRTRTNPPVGSPMPSAAVHSPASSVTRNGGSDEGVGNQKV